MFQRRYADNRPRGGGGVTPIPTGIVSNPVLDPALEGQNLSLTPAVVTSPPPAPTSTYTLYINSSPVVGYVGVSLATLQGYVWQAADEWLDAYVDETITSPWILGSPVTVSSNTVNVDGADNFIVLIQTNAGNITSPITGGIISPQTGTSSYRFYGNASSTYDIDWGDGTIQNGVSGHQTRTYASPGIYRVRTRNWTGAVKAFGLGATTIDTVKILELQQWGNTAWTSCNAMLAFAGRMVGTYSDAPNLSATTSCQSMMNSCYIFNGSPNASMNSWDVSAVPILQSCFANCPLFNQNISNWDVSSVTNMTYMFSNDYAFNQDLGAWVLNNSVTMNNMFDNSGMSTENYSRTLIGWANEWSATGDPINRSLGATGLTYHNTVYGGAPYDNAVSARAALVGATPGGAGWTITGDSLVP